MHIYIRERKFVKNLYKKTELKKTDLSEHLKMLIYIIYKILVFLQLTQDFYE